MPRKPHHVRIYFGTADPSRVFYRTESRGNDPIERCASPTGYASARYVRQRVAADFPDVKVVDDTMSERSKKANATRLHNAAIIAANQAKRARAAKRAARAV